MNSGVTLDGGGHLITGDGGQSERYGVYLTDDTTGATVKNVRVTKFIRGIRLKNASRNTIQTCESFENGNFTPSVMDGYGIDIVEDSSENLLVNNTIHGNANEGVHLGPGTVGNVVIGNDIFDNVVEQLYLLDSHQGRFERNHLWGSGTATLHAKQSTRNVFQDNAFEDQDVQLTDHATDNVFRGNTLIHTGYVLAKDHPDRNRIEGGSVIAAKECIRFVRAQGNMVIGTKLVDCQTDLSAKPTAITDNSVIDVAFTKTKVDLQGAILRVGWLLGVTASTPAGDPVMGASVVVKNRGGAPVANAMTDAHGVVAPLPVMAYLLNGDRDVRMDFTPHRVQGAEPGFAPAKKRVRLQANATVALTLVGAPQGDTQPPLVQITSTVLPSIPTLVALAGTATDNVGVTTLTWSNDRQPVGGPAQGLAPWTATVPLSPGDNHITVTATDAAGNQGTARVTVRASIMGSRRKPIAHAGAAMRSGRVNEELYFDGSSSFDPNGQIAEYRWTLGDGSQAAGRTVSHRYATPGSYQVQLTVLDNDGQQHTARIALTILP